jgi:hypothetical protein
MQGWVPVSSFLLVRNVRAKLPDLARRTKRSNLLHGRSFLAPQRQISERS